MTSAHQDAGGHIALLGRTNVGKSSLLNALAATKATITAARPHTTRAILYRDISHAGQSAICMDTPGEGPLRAGLLGKLMHKQMTQALLEAKGWVFVVDVHRLDERDDRFLRLLARTRNQTPLILALNKTDLLTERTMLFPLVTSLAKKLDRAGLQAEEIIPVSARTGYNIAQLKQAICALAPGAPVPHGTPSTSTAFIASELLREQLFRKLDKEVPFGLCVLCEYLHHKSTTLFIGLAILVTKENHKPIILGQKGERIKGMASMARRAMERAFSKKVMLEVRVRTERNWRNDTALLSRAVLGRA